MSISFDQDQINVISAILEANSIKGFKEKDGSYELNCKNPQFSSQFHKVFEKVKQSSLYKDNSKKDLAYISAFLLWDEFVSYKNNFKIPQQIANFYKKSLDKIVNHLGNDFYIPIVEEGSSGRKFYKLFPEAENNVFVFAANFINNLVSFEPSKIVFKKISSENFDASRIIQLYTLIPDNTSPNDQDNLSLFLNKILEYQNNDSFSVLFAPIKTTNFLDIDPNFQNILSSNNSIINNIKYIGNEHFNHLIIGGFCIQERRQIAKYYLASILEFFPENFLESIISSSTLTTFFKAVFFSYDIDSQQLYLKINSYDQMRNDASTLIEIITSTLEGREFSIENDTIMISCFNTDDFSIFLTQDFSAKLSPILSKLNQYSTLNEKHGIIGFYQSSITSFFYVRKPISISIYYQCAHLHEFNYSEMEILSFDQDQEFFSILIPRNKDILSKMYMILFDSRHSNSSPFGFIIPPYISRYQFLENLRELPNFLFYENENKIKYNSVRTNRFISYLNFPLIELEEEGRSNNSLSSFNFFVDLLKDKNKKDILPSYYQISNIIHIDYSQTPESVYIQSNEYYDDVRRLLSVVDSNFSSIFGNILVMKDQEEKEMTKRRNINIRSSYSQFLSNFPKETLPYSLPKKNLYGYIDVQNSKFRLPIFLSNFEFIMPHIKTQFHGILRNFSREGEFYAKNNEPVNTATSFCLKLFKKRISFHRIKDPIGCQRMYISNDFGLDLIQLDITKKLSLGVVPIQQKDVKFYRFNDISEEDINIFFCSLLRDKHYVETINRFYDDLFEKDLSQVKYLFTTYNLTQQENSLAFDIPRNINFFECSNSNQFNIRYLGQNRISIESSNRLEQYRFFLQMVRYSEEQKLLNGRSNEIKCPFDSFSATIKISLPEFSDEVWENLQYHFEKMSSQNYARFIYLTHDNENAYLTCIATNVWNDPFALYLLKEAERWIMSHLTDKPSICPEEKKTNLFKKHLILFGKQFFYPNRILIMDDQMETYLYDYKFEKDRGERPILEMRHALTLYYNHFCQMIANYENYLVLSINRILKSNRSSGEILQKLQPYSLNFPLIINEMIDDGLGFSIALPYNEDQSKGCIVNFEEIRKAISSSQYKRNLDVKYFYQEKNVVLFLKSAEFLSQLKEPLLEEYANLIGMIHYQQERI